MTTIRPRSPQHADEIVEALAPLLARQRRKWAERCHEHGLSIIGFHVLALLEMNGAMPMGRLAEDLGVALPNATGIVGRMEERGIVARSHDEADRRVVLVDLTDEGRDLIDEMESERRQRMHDLFGELDGPAQRRLLQSVHDLRAAALRLAASEESPT